uniref:DUF4283 domain-containing protein n=1 Tax=Kalanchoe fedtschenkoi TaxID=63787 RepID=A0A7N0TEN9_KALFE
MASPTPTVAGESVPASVELHEVPQIGDNGVDRAKPHQIKESWASIVSGNRRIEDKIVLENDDSFTGGNDVFLEEEVWAEGIDDWSSTLVGNVFGMSPSLFTMRNYISRRWGDESIVTVYELRKGVFLFYFESRQKMDDIMENGPWPFNN